jgi:hypothetical protein
VAALLRAAAVYQENRQRGGAVALLDVLHAIDDVAAAYLGEEPQP